LYRWLEKTRRTIAGLTSVVDNMRKKDQDTSGSQRMCPFCGLITPTAKRTCMECGKALRGHPGQRKNARQE
jgi:predicted amidophosphoribosyltransferase